MLSLASFNKLKFFSNQRHKKQNTSFSSNRIPIAPRNILSLSSLFQRPGSFFPHFSILKMSGTSNENHYPYDMKNLSPHLTIKDAIDRHGPKFEEFPLDSPSPFVKPRKVLYDFDGKQRRWDLIEAHPSVSVILYHKDLDSWLLVRQFRPPVYAVSLREARAADPSAPAPPFSAGFTYELCAGLVDKAKLSLAEICREEILEECGFDVPLSSIRYVSTATSATGCMGAKHDIFFAEVTKGMQSGEPGVGGGLAEHGECIEVLALPRCRTLDFILDGTLNKSPGLMFGLLWADRMISKGELGEKQGKEEASIMTGELLLRSVPPS